MPEDGDNIPTLEEVENNKLFNLIGCVKVPSCNFANIGIVKASPPFEKPYLLFSFILTIPG